MVVDKQEVIKVFKQIYEIQEDVKSYNSTISDFKKLLADDLKVPTDVISKAYTNWVMSIEKPDKLSSIDELLEAIQ